MLEANKGIKEQGPSWRQIFLQNCKIDMKIRNIKTNAGVIRSGTKSW